MTKPTKALTAKRMAGLTPGRYRDREARGLYLQVGPTGTQSWLLRYELNGRERWHGLGSANDFSLREARERARKARQLLADGIDPVEAKRAAKTALALEAAKQQEAVTFAMATERYLAKQSPEWRNARTAPLFLSRMKRYAFPILGKLPVEEIDKKLLMTVLEPLWATKPNSGSRLRAGIENVLNWCIARDLRPGPNPAEWSGNLAELLPKPGRVKPKVPFKAIDYREVPAFMLELRERDGVAAAALQFTILTAVRSAEARAARWDEIDLEAKLWSIPAERMKAARPHEVPLSDAAIELLRSLPTEEGNPYVFISAKPGSHLQHTAMMLLLGRMKRNDITVHGMRSAFRTWAAERTAFPDYLAELCLAHTVGSEVERAYKRTSMLQKESS